MFDTVCKFLAETFATDFASWLLGEPITLTELSPSELSLEPIRADALMLLQSEQIVLHVEFQTSPDPDIPFRMLDYRVRVYRRFPRKPMRQVVIYLQQTQSPQVYQTAFSIPDTHHQFTVIRLWEQPLNQFLSTPGLLPFAVLSQTPDPIAALRQVATQIEAIPEPRLQSNVAASTAILAGLILEKATIQQILRRELMQESVIYQDIWEEARQKGMQEGKLEGIREGKLEGIREGIEEGQQRECLTIVLRLLHRRFGDLPTDLQTQIEHLSLDQLETLAEDLFDISTLSDLTTWLTTHR